MEIKVWLESLALSDYEPAFRAHQITADLLVELSDEDLRSMGIAALGARKRLLKAIAALRVAGPEAMAPATTSFAPAERRYLTVMFADMVGSTSLSTELDPEDLGTVLAGFHAAIAAQVAAFGGFTARSFGDGLLAYFGYPEAHEDDAERAVLAALAAIDSLRDGAVRGRRASEVRIGVASGWGVLGDLAGTAQHEVVGQTPNLAARLLRLAQPGETIISEQTARLLGNTFELTDLGTQRLDGFGIDQRAYRVSSARAAARFDVRAERGLTALVGREADLGILRHRWGRIAEGESQVVLITGEPGIGKSRLVRCLQDTLRTTPHLALRWQCSPFHVNSALHPAIRQFNELAGFLREDDGHTQLAKLQRLLPDCDGIFTDLLAELLSVPGVAVPALPPEEKKVRLFAGLIDWIHGLAGDSPVLLVVEDAHWIDPTTAELLDRIVEAVSSAPSMVLVTGRPEYQARPEWMRLDRFSHHFLNRLSRRESAELVEKIGGTMLHADVADEIVTKADGVPLFVEELTKAVLESDVTAGRLPSLSVPATLQNSLMARLDRLPSAKPVAQVGAALGREFSHTLIAAVADVDGAMLDDALDLLRSAGLLFERRNGTARAYTFKHALVRDAAYESLLRSHRTKLHGRIAATIEAQFPALKERQPEVVARHWTEAGEAGSAITWWRMAGQRALSRLAFHEALAHFDNALALFPRLEATEEHTRLIAALWLECATVLRQTHWGGQRMEDAARQALSIGISLNDSAMIGHALAALAEVAAVRPDFALFRETNREFLRLELCMADGLDTKFMLAAGRELRPLPGGVDRSVLRCLSKVDGITLDDKTALLQLAEEALGRSATRGRSSSARASTVWQFLGLEMFWRGHFAGIDRILQRAIDSARPDDPSYVGWRQNLLAKTWLAFSAAQLGRFDMGRALARQCIEEADQIAEVSHLVLALNAHNVFCFYCDDAGAVGECAARLEEVSFRYGIAWYQPAALLARAWAHAQAGAFEAARAVWPRGRAMLTCGIFEQIHVGVPHLLAVSAHVAAAIDLPEEALIDIDRGLALAAQTGEAHSESELHRAKGEIVLGMGDSINGERYFRTARAIARNQSAKGLELRAAISLARLLLQQRRSDEAYDVLTPVHDWFQQGFDEPILRQAKWLRNALDRTRGSPLPPKAPAGFT